MKHKGEVLKLFVEWKKNLEKSMGRRSRSSGQITEVSISLILFVKLCHNNGIDMHFTVRENIATKRGSRKDEHDCAREGPLYVIQCRITKEFLG